MNAELLLDVPVISPEQLAWARAALRECMLYGDHGTYTETVGNNEVCFDCGGAL